MITLFASIAGFISSIFPEIFKLLNDRNDKKQELAIMQLQIEAAKINGIQRMDEIGVKADMTELKELMGTYSTGVKWVDAFNGTVRPVLTYSFFVLYAVVKYLQYSVIGSSAPMYQYLDVLWNTEDQAIFAGIISFYFGQRAMGKIRGGK